MAVETKTYQGSQQQYEVLIDRDVVMHARDGTPSISFRWI